MRFLRLKPRRVEAVTVGTSGEEEEEEGRQGLLPEASKNERSSAYLHNLLGLQEGASLHHAPSPAAFNSKQQQQQQQQQQAPASNTQIVVLKACLHCEGCTRRVKKSLSKLQGVNTFHVDMQQQKVTVIGNVRPDDVLQNVKKVLKGTQFWEAPNKPTSPDHGL